MKEVAYHGAALPEHYRVLGVSLRTFALGHLLLLHRTQNAFVCGRTPTYDDLAMGVLICSRSFEDGLRVIGDPATPKLLKRWEARLAGRGWMTRLGFRKARVIDLAKQAGLFRQYMKEGQHIPEHEDSETIREIAVPMLHYIWATFTRIGFSDSEIMNRGWWLCVQQDYILKALQGGLTLRDPEKVQEMVSEAQDVANRVAELIKEGRLKL